jgi:hypothetical protein
MLITLHTSQSPNFQEKKKKKKGSVRNKETNQDKENDE